MTSNVWGQCELLLLVGFARAASRYRSVGPGQLSAGPRTPFGDSDSWIVGCKKRQQQVCSAMNMILALPLVFCT